MKSLRMSSFMIAASVLGASFVAVACTHGSPSERADVRNEPVGTATLQLGAMIVEPAKGESGSVAAAHKAAAANDACPSGMVLVEGEYCPEVEHKCLEWMDPPQSRYAHFRCKRYEKSATCKGPKVHRRYCIDATERTESDTKLPRHFMSWTTSKALCESEGARLCRESEWIFACEGEEMRPYPYGWERDTTACNTDITEGIGKVGRLNDLRSEVGSHAKCASPFGVQDMAGNVEEWTQADGPGQGSKMGWKEVLKGSWWIPSRHACRQFQVGHNDVYNGGETGTRCCKDAPPREVASR
jgi:sulfatase modifying factor 1